MRLDTVQRRPPDPMRGALLLCAWLIAGLGVALLSRLTYLWPVCPFRDWTGLPCLTCGSTRMIDALVSGQLLEAALGNPLVFLGLAMATAWVVVAAGGMALGRPLRVTLPTSRRRHGLWLLAVVVLAANWAYLIWRGV